MILIKHLRLLFHNSFFLKIELNCDKENVLILNTCSFQKISGQFPPRKINPRLGLGFGLQLGLVLGLGGNFPGGQLS